MEFIINSTKRELPQEPYPEKGHMISDHNVSTWDKKRGQTEVKSKAGERKKGPSVSPAHRKATPKTRAAKGKKKGYKTTKDTGELERELKGFLKGERLPLGIVASEVLGPSRSKRSYSRRKT